MDLFPDAGVVQEVLARLGTARVSDLPYLAIRWREPRDQPVPFFFGLVSDLTEDEIDEFLGATGETSLEAPLVEEVDVRDDAPQGARIRRSTTYSTDADDGTVIVGLRYVVTGLVAWQTVLAHTALPSPAQALEAVPDLDDLVRTFTVELRS